MNMDRRSFLKKLGATCAGLLAAGLGLGSAAESLGQPRGGQHWKRPGRRPDFRKNRPGERPRGPGRPDTQQGPGPGPGGPAQERNTQVAQITKQISAPKQVTSSPSQGTDSVSPDTIDPVMPPSSRGRMLASLASAPGGLAILQQKGIIGADQNSVSAAELEASYSPEVQQARQDDALAMAYSLGVECDQYGCDYEMHPDLDYGAGEGPVEYYSERGSLEARHIYTCYIRRTSPAEEPFLWFEIETPGDTDEYVTYAIELLTIPFIPDIDIRMNGEELEWYEATSPYFTSEVSTYMALVSLPGSRDQRHIMELSHADTSLVKWEWLTMCSA